MKLADYVIVWADTVPHGNGLADTAQRHGGELLAAGLVHDVSERDARAAPAGLVIARFGNPDHARAWCTESSDELRGTALLVAGAADPVWWPAEQEAVRPEWSRRAELPRDRLGLFVCVWAEVRVREQFFDYSQHYRWTVEHDGGVVLVPGARPSQELLRGGPGPDAMALMGWPADERARHSWYEGPLYRPYRDQRHHSSRTTNISVLGAGMASRDLGQ
jgi:uncharacterized protein (DUF1330 family)